MQKAFLLEFFSVYKFRFITQIKNIGGGDKMKKSKLVKSLISIVLSAVLMFSLFSFSVVHKTAMADMSLNSRLQTIGNGISKLFTSSGNNSQTDTESASGEKVYLGGFPIGLKLYAEGVIVVGTEPVDTENGLVNTAEAAGLKIGDIIIKVNGKNVTRNTEISDYMEKSAGETVEFTVKRNEEIFVTSFKGAFSKSENKYKAGIWVRDSSAGIGTVTFYTLEGRYASLGHAVCDIDTKITLPISKGDCTGVRLTGYRKGENSTAGELCGYLENQSTGTVEINGELGVYGVFSGYIDNGELYEIASADEIEEGAASIFTTIDDSGVKEYSVKIEKIDKFDKENKHLVIKITDTTLTEKTGGIIQGMSGSPIIQNGKIVGAVTHVFLNDSTGGYGILAEKMLGVTNNLFD